MIHPKISIFGFPRSGTKLLASVLAQQGFHNFGEFFTENTEIVQTDKPYAIRLTRDTQRALYKRRRAIGKIQDDIIINSLVKKRLDVFNQYKNLEPSTVTFWLINLTYLPDLINQMSNRFFLCPRRHNKFDQLKSMIVSSYNFNYDRLYESVPITVNLDHVDDWISQMIHIDHIQSMLVNSGRGRYVDFDKLISGQEELGFEYKVTTQDEHLDLDHLILNIDEVTARIKSIKNIFDEFKI
jgi:hypothetical protein